MNCDDGEEISIENAWYGRTSTSECSAGLSDGMFDDEFYQICNSGLNVTTDAAAVCDGKNTCQFRLEHFGLFDPCVNIYKYTKILYSCMRKQKAYYNLVSVVQFFFNEYPFTGYA